jgi:hemerythrin
MGDCRQRQIAATGNAMIDREHQALAELIEKVHLSSRSQDRDIEIMRALTDMYLYAKSHFFDEEALMEQLGYPERERHAGLHKDFLARTHDLTDACLEGGLNIDELAGFLWDWLARHVDEEDARIIAFATTQGRDEF